jgi:hypothetical protein
MLLLSLPSLWFIVVTSFIASIVFNHGIIREMDHGCLSLPLLPVVVELSIDYNINIKICILTVAFSVIICCTLFAIINLLF